MAPLPLNASLAAAEVNLKSTLEFVRTGVEKMIDRLMSALGSVVFLIITLTTIVLWILYNTGVFGFEPFDPYPFVGLECCVAISAMILAIIVLIGQNRQAKLAEIRQQIDFEINVRTEHEVTKILNMLDASNHDMGIARADLELEQMKVVTDISEIKENVEEVMRNQE